VKITALQAIPLAIPHRPMTPPSPWSASLAKQILVRVDTDEGLVGWGECFAYGAPLAVCSVVEEALAPIVVGQDPTRIEHLTRALHQALMIWGRRGLGLFALSGVELALWDLAGKARGVPAYALLGGLVQPAVRAYASLSCAIRAQDVGRAAGRHGRAGLHPPSSSTRSMSSPWQRAMRWARRGPDARHQLPVERGGGHPHRATARAHDLAGWRSRCGRPRTTRASPASAPPCAWRCQR
jgi:hypothetical protein